MSDREIFDKVKKVLMETLNVDKEDITPAATLQKDLGAESIDFLDLVFCFEREFGIRIPHDEMFPEFLFQEDSELVRDGKFTDRGLSELHAQMPFADFRSFDRNPRLCALPDLFTVELLHRYIAWKLGVGQGALHKINA